MNLDDTTATRAVLRGSTVASVRRESFILGLAVGLIVATVVVMTLMRLAKPADAACLPADAALQTGYGVPSDDAAGDSAGNRVSDSVDILWLPDGVREFLPVIDANCPPEVDREHAALVVLVEAWWKLRTPSTAGALGLWQVMAIYHPSILDGNPNDPAHNTRVGCAYLAKQLRTYGIANEGGDWLDSVVRASIAYNAGTPRGLHVTDVDRGPKCGIVFPGKINEHRRYGCWIASMWRTRHDADSAGYRAWTGMPGLAVAQ